MPSAVRLLTVPGVSLAHAQYGFTTREGGVSSEPFRSLNLAVVAQEDPAHVAENWARVAAALDARVGQIALLSQVHGVDVVRVTRGNGALTVVAEADAAVCTERDVVLAVRVADCVPVLFAAPGGVAVAHAGWRGAAGRIVPKTVAALCDAAHCEPADVIALVGPCIAVDSYETGADVVDALVASGVPRAVAAPSGPWEREHADVRAVVAAQLHALGVVTHHVRRDTATDPALFSYRRDDGVTGRLAGVIRRR